MAISRKFRGQLDDTVVQFMHHPLASKGLNYLAYQHRRAQRRVIERRLKESGDLPKEVIFGPFSGLKYPDEWASCKFEKLIGAYEAELHQLVESIISGASYSSIVNAGSAEGYYTVGLARRIPGIHTISYDLRESNQDYVKKLAKLNGVENQVEVRGRCTPEELASLEVGASPLLICDVDTYETVLLDPVKVPWLNQGYILVETHDCLEAGITETIRKRFSASHDITQLSSKGLDYSNYPLLRKLSFAEIHIMTGEERRAIQDWLWMTPKERPAA